MSRSNGYPHFKFPSLGIFSLQIYCCISPQAGSLEELPTLHLTEKKSAHMNRNKTDPIINIEKNKIAKPFHSNDIDKQIRQKRDTFSEEANFFDMSGKHEKSKSFYNIDDTVSDDQSFRIIISGRNFNTTLTNKYRITSSNLQYNISYAVPISKYMPDEFINLIFR